MKKVLAVLVIVLFSTASFAQEWLNGGGNIYTNNTLFPNAKVGIGTTSPSHAIHAVTNDNTSMRLESNYSSTTTLKTLGQFQTLHTGSGDMFMMAFRQNAGGYRDMLQSCKDGATGSFYEFMYFRYDTRKWEMRNGVVDAEFQNSGKLLLNSTNGVGVAMGTTPIPAGAKLAVGGKVVCKEIEVTLTGLPDYVFNSDYKLRSLYDVENFVKTNKHLPDVPSEKEVLANGLNLGDMSSVLLKKVEELTLYMIELKKENDQLKERIQKLEK